MTAIDSSNPLAVEQVLDSGVNPNAFPNSDRAKELEEDVAPLDDAAANGNVTIVRILLDHGADPNMGDGWNGTPLMAAEQNKHMDAMRLLIQRGAKVNDDAGGSEVLWEAAQEGNQEAATLLLDHGANPRTQIDQSLIDELVQGHGSAAIIAELRKRAKAGSTVHPRTHGAKVRAGETLVKTTFDQTRHYLLKRDLLNHPNIVQREISGKPR